MEEILYLTIECKCSLTMLFSQIKQTVSKVEKKNIENIVCSFPFKKDKTILKKTMQIRIKNMKIDDDFTNCFFVLKICFCVKNYCLLNFPHCIQIVCL